MKFAYLIAVGVAAASLTGAAHAVVITGLYNTGVDNTGVATTGNGADQHWQLNGGAAFTGGTNGNFPIGPWLAETAASRWLTPTSNAADSFDATSDGLIPTRWRFHWRASNPTPRVSARATPSIIRSSRSV